MQYQTALSLVSSLVLAAAATAQNCSDNSFPIRLVDVAGNVLPSTGSGSSLAYHAPTESVFMAFDAALPSGIYYVHVTDPIGGHDEVLSLNDPSDRFVQVTNTAGVITLSLPYSVSPEVPAFGAGPGGVGQTLPIFPYLSASWEPCHFKAWLGNSWATPIDPANPYLLRGGYDADLGACRIRSYVPFDVGDGTGSDVTGFVFEDLDRNGLLDSGEPGLEGEEVRLVGPAGTVTALTDNLGNFRFVDVPAGDYNLEITVTTGSVATTPTSRAITVCSCGDLAVDGFGKVAECVPCDGHTIGYWRNCNGLRLITQQNLLPQICSLPLVNGCGRRVSFANLQQYACWLQDANATNMAYMLSAQLVAMYLNVATGFVHESCELADADLGTLTVGELMAQAIASLNANPYTPRCHPARTLQERLKRALDDANNNRNWVNNCGCNDGSTGGCNGGSSGGCSGGSSGGHGGGGDCHQGGDPRSNCDPKPSCRPSRPSCGHHASWSRCR